ncbi:TatD family hydrolase [Gluconacetobacter takamatsuzukensis]|uniref:TatD family hydrolase n=1 Tax=Gluconacetobacter takamatsuzukensis TaxID=1286190 RepID=A0A7W4KDB0_9PROT|nr:TatD family hydrolase [Gluconacetobacter takamatsuzukensis]MBB2204843.1 TatD family hydrolase [Gluconacetobacter takamatsuzukensis]
MSGAATGLIDSHCHLDHFTDEEIPELLDRARAAGVDGMVTIGTRLSRAQQQKDLTRFDRPDVRVWCTVGTHPDHVEECAVADAEGIIALADDRRVVGIGESGLDYFHGAEAVRPLQQARFRAHIAAARRMDLPLVIHAREADADVAAILREEVEAHGRFRFLLHCFASGPELARVGLELGGYISFSGILTFPRSDALRAVARDVPADRLLVETDSPYLAPVPRRGKRNEPALVAHTAQRLAEERGMTPGHLAEQTTTNFRRLFSRAI